MATLRTRKRDRGSYHLSKRRRLWKSKTIIRVYKLAKSAETLALENAIDTARCKGQQLDQIKTGCFSK